MARTLPRRRTLLTALLGIIIVVVGLLGLTPAAQSAPGATTAGSHDEAKPTIVLVHGSWADASSWTEVVKRLQQEGYQVVAPPNPLRSLSGDAEYISTFLSTVPGPIVLVGHSYGGAVITNAATGNPNVKALVYVDAFAPDEGEQVLPLTRTRLRSGRGGPHHGLRSPAVPRRPGRRLRRLPEAGSRGELLRPRSAEAGRTGDSGDPTPHRI